MTKDDRHVALDFGELIALVAEEINAGRLATEALGDTDRSRLRVSTVKVGLGQTHPPGPDEANADRGVLLLDRYPLARSGWQVEIAMGPGPSEFAARPDGGPWQPVPLPGRPTLREVFGELPVVAVKGAASTWSSLLGEIGVRTVDDLATAPPDRISELIRRTKSVQPRELQTKVRALDVVPPRIPDVAAARSPLRELVAMTPRELREHLGARVVSMSASEQLVTVVGLLFMVLDARHIRDVPLADLSRQGDLEPPPQRR